MGLEVPSAIILTVVMFVVNTTHSDTPNVVLIVADDLSFGDLGCFGNTTLRTPNLDQLALQGVKLTHNLAAYPTCTPSRAAFLTGRYPIRSGMLPKRHLPVFAWTSSASGLPAAELTIGKVAKSAKYRTAFLGKWHLGWSLDRSNPDHHHPLNQGFDYFYGVPLSNMPDFQEDFLKLYQIANPSMPFQFLTIFTLVLITTACLVREHYIGGRTGFLAVALLSVVGGYWYFAVTNFKLLNSFMFRNYDLVEQPIHLPSVTRKLVMESEEFLAARHEDNVPFLLLLSWLHVHTALATGPQFRGQSSHGPYGDAVQEMDWGVGQLMDMLERYGMVNNTFVYFTSDHGSTTTLTDLKGRPTGGSSGPFTGTKNDGGNEASVRVPGIIRWPGKIEAGKVIDEPVSLMDMLPTVASLLQVKVSSDPRLLDGASLLPLVTGQEKVSPHEFLFHYCFHGIHAVRYRPRTGHKIWRLKLREIDPRKAGNVDACVTARHLDPPKLYELTSDPTSTLPLDPEQHSETIATILKAVEDHEKSLVPVSSQFALHRNLWNPWTQPCCNFPRCQCQDDKFRGMFTE